MDELLLFEDVSNAAEELLEEAAAAPDLLDFFLRFFLNFVVVGALIHLFYYPKSKRRDYYFTFMLVNICIFVLIFLLGGVKIKVGFALGIFAIFGIIRYRTETLPVREMTYLFAITALSVINALAPLSWTLVIIDTIILLVTWILESEKWLEHTSCKLVLYDKIDLIVPEKYEEMLADLKKRTGLNIVRVEVGHVDFLKDAAMLKVYYESPERQVNSVDKLVKFPKEES